MNATTLAKLTQTWLSRLGVVQILPVVTALFVLSATNALAALIAYEPFNYSGAQVNNGTTEPSGAPTQTTGGGWVAGTWACAPAAGGALALNSFGLAYPGLPAANKSISTLGANYLYEKIASAPTTGSVFVSFLFQQNGDNGGNRNGIILENSAGTGIMFAYQQFTTQGKPCIMAMTSTVTVGAQLANSANPQTYANTNLYVLEFVYTANVVSSIKVYSNPTAGQGTAPSPDFTVSSGFGTIGALVNFGLANPGPNQIINVDEFRVGTTFADVVGVSAFPVNASITSPTNTQTVDKYSFTVSANATVSPGTVTNVAFYLDAALFTNLTASPFNCSVTGVSTGAHTLKAVATDSSGNNATSSVVNVTAADFPPSVTLTNPANASQILTGSSVSLGASASDDSTVTNVAFYVDGTLVGNSTTSPYSASWIATPGAHVLTAVATDNVSQNTTSAVVNVTGKLPTVAITSPTNTQTVSIYSYNATATASVSPGTITNVAFYVDAVLFSNLTTSPYTITVSGALAGAHTLSAVATDSNGNTTNSSIINVTAADLPPSVSVTNPVAGSFLTGSNLTLGAKAADDNVVTNVAFYVDGSLVGSSTTSPYGAPWTVTAGAHALTAVAYDSAGQTATSAVVSVTGTLPVVAITSPTNTQAVSIYNYNITATATVVAGTITNVAFYVDSVLFSNKTTPYTITVTGALAGAHTLQAVGMDNNGNAVTSSVVNITAADLAPSVTVTNPAAGGAVLLGSAVTIGASATDDSAVTNVAFYVDGTLVGSTTTSPYSTTWGVASLGSHALTAVATDNAGQNTTSAVVNVTAVLNFNAYEPFNYGTGTFNSGSNTTATGFSGAWTCSTAGTMVSGLTYSALPTANNALRSAGGYQYEKLATPISSGTVWVSFLLQQAGDNGGGRDGISLVNSSGTGVMFAYQQNGTSIGQPALGTVTGFNAWGTQLASSGTTRTYNTPNLYVLRIIYNGSGVVTNIAVYSDPTAGQSTAPSPDFTVTSGLGSVGTISAIGIGHNSTITLTLDEVRTGTSFGQVVGVALPSAPTALIATPGNAQVSLSWTAPGTGSPTGYYVKRSTTSGFGYTTIYTNAATTTYTDATAVNGTTYYYVVSGTNAAGEGAISAQASATPVAPPGQAQSLVATPGVNMVGLNWVATSGATGYNVLRGTSSGTYNVTNSSAANSYTDNTAAGGTTYYYVVQATNAGGAGPISSEVSALPTIALPTAPASLTATPANSQVGLSWPVGTGASSYNVKRSTTSGAETTIGTAPGTSYTDATAVNGSIYYYEVSSTNSAGESANSVEATAAMPPAAPTGLGATPGANQVALSWTASAGLSGATSYNVKRSTTSGAETTLATGVTGTSYTDSTAISGTTYFYVVSGVNASGQGNDSTEVSTTPTGVPQAPTSLTLTTNYLSLTLNWTAALGAPTGYNVKRSTSTGGETTLPAGTNVAGTSFTDTTVVTGTQYFYTVSAVNGSGEGADSAEVTGAATGLPTAYEPFNYESLANGNATTGTGFTGNWQITNSVAIVAGLTYNYLYTSNSALLVTGGNQYENLSIPLYSGTVYVSFLYHQNGDFGGNRGGFQLLNGSGNGVMFAYHQSGGNAGLPSIDAITGYNNVGSELGVSATTQTYATPNLYVMRLDYGAGGILTNISFYSNPLPGQGAPAPDFSVSSGLSGIGAITTLGMHTGISSTVDEWRVGTTFSSVVVGESNAIVTLGNLSQAYDGTAKNATATTTPPGLTVALTYNGSINAPTNVGTYPVIGTVVDLSNTYYGSASNNLVISKGPATVALGSLAQTYDGTPRSATATTTPPGLAVNFTYDGLPTAPTNAGTYQVVGTVADASYQGSATNNLVVSQAAAAVTLGSLSQTYDGTAKSATATTTPPGLVVAITYDGSSDAPTNIGTYLVIGTVTDSNYYGGATNNLLILSPVNSSPTNIVTSISGNQLTLSWPADHTGWKLQTQTNDLSTGITATWYDVAGSAATNQMTFTIDPASPSVFYRMTYP
ncbi:MAG TPA: Ig-like domain-containing protein [Verrucomicrobiae bacterium]|nr:Ig-like domain-containing protein [Verrucomicrobiae bacterium]